jgi:nanoRNase/pAp phosphatase (c-di-AMP/oligoRNAs hydrolase)
MTISAAERLRRFYAVFSGQDQVLIVINADPDAIASAMAAKRLLWRKVAGVTISNINVIKRPDNITMIRLMGIDLAHISKIDKSRYSRFVIIDSQPNHNDAFATFRPDAIIDHHPETGAEASFLDIRPKYGATASIMTEYLRAAKIKPSAKLAAGLYHAIRTDTNNFAGQALMEDLRAFQFLFRHANIHLARKIEQADLKVNFLKFFKIAFEGMKRRRGRLFAHLGSVTNPDVCVIIADFFMRVDAVNWSIISGLYNKKLILVFRNDGLREDAGKLAGHRFGQLGSAGGHKSMARAEIPIVNLTAHVDFRDDKKLLMWIIGQIEKSTAKK